MATSSLMLTQEELWVLTWLLSGANPPGISFEPLEKLDDAQKNTLRQILLRILWARGFLEVAADGQMQPRAKVRRLLRPVLFPQEIYFYGRQEANGSAETLFFTKRGATQVAYSMLKPFIYYFVLLVEPAQMLQIVGAALNLGAYEKQPFDVPPFEIEISTLYSLQKKARQQRAMGKQDRSVGGEAGEEYAALPEMGVALLEKTFQSFEAYHAFSWISFDGARRGFTLLQGKDYLWVLEPVSENVRKLYLVDGEYVAKKLREFFHLDV